MNFAVTILGNNSALPAHGRHPTSQLVTFHDRCYLVDCGEGTQIQMSTYRIHGARIRHIFISHMHGDHYFGLIGLLNSFGLQNRTQPLHIFAPAPLEEIIRLQLEAAATHLPFSLDFTALEPSSGGIILEEEDLVVRAFPTDHHILCFGFLFERVHRKRILDPGKARACGIPTSFFKQLQQGADYLTNEGERIPNKRVTIDPPRGKRYAFCADTRYDERLIPHIAGSDLIYHETTYLKDQEENARNRFHSTGLQAAALAAKAGGKKLIVGHFSSKYEEIAPFLEECLPVFPATELAIEGVTYLV